MGKVVKVVVLVVVAAVVMGCDESPPARVTREEGSASSTFSEMG